MASNRIFYAVQKANVNGNSKRFQSISINASVDFEQVFELGCLDIYENLEGIPSAEITAERAVAEDGGSQWDTFDYGLSTAASKDDNYARLYVMDDSKLGGGDQSHNDSYSSGIIYAYDGYVSSYSVNMPVDGFATDTLTLVCDSLSWARVNNAAGQICVPGAGSQAANGTDRPRVRYRNDYAGVSNKGIQNVSFSVDIGREDLFELGKKSPFFRAATYPIEVTADIEVLANSNANRAIPFGNSSDGNSPWAGDASQLSFVRDPSNSNTNITEDLHVAFGGYNMGSGVRLVGTNWAGGDAGGGNATITYSYLGYNYLNG